MMLDTFVEASDWPEELAFERPIDRGFAVIRFLRYLLKKDRTEVQLFIEREGWKRYEEYFGQKQLLSSCIQGCTKAIMAIAASRDTSGRPPSASDEIERLRIECTNIESLASLKVRDAIILLPDIQE